MSTIVYLGNHAAVEERTNPDGTKTRIPAEGKRYTIVKPPDGTPLAEAFREITMTRLWPAMSDADKPAWVACTDPNLGNLLAAHWGIELRDVEEGAPTC